MSGTDIRVTFNHIPAVMIALNKSEDNLAQDLAELVRKDAAAKAPILTGNLKRTIHVEKVNGTNGATYITQANTQYLNPALRDYAAYVEFGTRHMRAQPYMYPAYIMMMALLYPTAAIAVGAPVEIAAKTGRT